MNITPSEGITWPATAELAVAAPSDQVSATKTSGAHYGFSDPHSTTFGHKEEHGKFINNFDSHLKSSPLHVERARLFLNWSASPSNKELTDWLKAVKVAGLKPFITLRECEPTPEEPTCPIKKAPTLGEYYTHVKALMKVLIKGNSERPAVRLWGSWNEPDHHRNALHKHPITAAYLWGETQLAAEKAECHHLCKVVAGEFASYLGHHDYVNKYETAIMQAERKHHFPVKVKPHFWGMHDYSDLGQVKGVKEGDKEVLGNYANKEVKGFVRQTKKLYGSSYIWLTEQGVLLQTGEVQTRLYRKPELQRLAARDFLRLGRASEHVEWAYYYLYYGPSAATVAKKPHAFDSALLPGEGVTEEDHHPAENPRQAYCVLALGLEGCPARSSTKAAISSTITPSAGTVLATIDPQGSATNYWLEWGTSTEYGHTTTATAVANQNGEQSETVALSGLEPCTVYHYQAEAENSANEGTPSLGGDQTFQTGGCVATAVTASDGGDACALLSIGGIDCWGSNEEGGLGDGTTTTSSVPVRVSGITNATGVAAGPGYTCALLSGGGVDCWGRNVAGTLGNGTTEDSLTPVAVSGITNAIAVTAGKGAHTCALLSSGSIDCWGTNDSGELGDGTTEDSLTPVAVSGITNAIAVTAGEYSSCALLSGGSIDCWGSNNFGELGNGTGKQSSTPVAVSGITNATAITAGNVYTCALLSSGSIDCWGYNEKGELGNSTTEDSLTPVAVSGITNATAVTAGAAATCALLSGGSIDCWGDNQSGKLGNGTTTGPEECPFRLSSYKTACSAVPVAVSGLTNAIAVAPGGGSACALLLGGGVDCWGYGGSGQLGNGTMESSLTPVSVIGFG